MILITEKSKLDWHIYKMNKQMFLPKNHDDLPLEGQTFYDIEDRKFLVHCVQVGDYLGREVIGFMDGKSYSCTLETWRDIWRDRCPRADPAIMRIG